MIFPIGVGKDGHLYPPATVSRLQYQPRARQRFGVLDAPKVGYIPSLGSHQLPVLRTGVSSESVKSYLKQHLVPANAIGIALYEKFGFEIEVTHRRYALRNSEYVDAYSMARVRD